MPNRTSHTQTRPIKLLVRKLSERPTRFRKKVIFWDLTGSQVGTLVKKTKKEKHR